MADLSRLLVCALTALILLGSSQAIAQKRRVVDMPDQILQALTSEDESVQKCINSIGNVRKIFKTEQVDLSKDSSSEIMVRGISPCVCGPKKCINRIYQKEKDRYELLFKADYAQEIELQKDYKNGYRNIWAAVYVYGSFTSVLYEYQYNGKQYEWDHCLMRFYIYSETRNGVPFSGRVRYHPRESISWVGCYPDNP
jgi:hypothetical protein